MWVALARWRNKMHFACIAIHDHSFLFSALSSCIVLTIVLFVLIRRQRALSSMLSSRENNSHLHSVGRSFVPSLPLFPYKSKRHKGIRNGATQKQTIRKVVYAREYVFLLACSFSFLDSFDCRAHSKRWIIESSSVRLRHKGLRFGNTRFSLVSSRFTTDSTDSQSFTQNVRAQSRPRRIAALVCFALTSLLLFLVDAITRRNWMQYYLL